MWFVVVVTLLRLIELGATCGLELHLVDLLRSRFAGCLQAEVFYGKSRWWTFRLVGRAEI